MANPILVVGFDGSAASERALARDEGAEIIVVGATGTGYVTRARLGSTAENLVRQAPCDVLVVR